MACLRRKSRRRGGFIIEAVISVALLATGMFALTRLAQTSSQLHRQSDNRLAAKLAAENVFARIEGAPAESVETLAAQAAKAVQTDSGCTIKLSTEPFETAGRSGVHLQVEATAGTQVSLTMHRWYFDPQSSPPQEQEADDES